MSNFEVGLLINVLLVEDNPGDVRLIKEVFEDAKVMIKLTVVEDGQAALNYLRQNRGFGGESGPLLVILDINLPGKNGLAVLREIKEDKNLLHIPVVVFSSSDDRYAIESGYDLRASAYVVKPGNYEEFVKAVSRIMEFWMDIARIPGTDGLN
ncbi:MAG: response regulator [Chloroflexota bacterium]